MRDRWAPARRATIYVGIQRYIVHRFGEVRRARLVGDQRVGEVRRAHLVGDVRRHGLLVSGSHNFAISNMRNLSDGRRREAGVSQCGAGTCGERLR